MKRAHKHLLRATAFITGIAVTATVASSFYFYHLAFERSKKTFLSGNPDLKFETKETAEAANVPVKEEPKVSENWIDSHGYSEFTVTTEDDLQLKAYYIPAEVTTTKTIILAHGYTSKGKDMSYVAQKFHEDLGYNILMPDDRGHGESEGGYIGFGWPDRLDYLKWIDLMIQEIGEDAQIALYGVSMGGATVMMVSGEPLPPQVKAIIEDCGYSSVEDQLDYQLDRMYSLPSFPIMPATSIMTRIRAGYDFYEASSVKQVKKATVPMFFIHGDADTFVPTDMVYKVYEACPTEKELWVVKDASHAMAFSQNPEVYMSRVSNFLTKYIH